MPLVRIVASEKTPESKRNDFLKSASRLAAETLGKPESYMMVVLEDGAGCMSGAAGKCAFVEVRSIGGLSPEKNKALSAKLCGLLEEALGIPAKAVYLNFLDVPAPNWGWNKSTFG